ncbi:MAG: cobalamin biosynthesis protein CbiD [Nitrospirae bacterium]|nr:cobalamin biosynthesis protein CbiD [Nitrospirota bacterium]
MRKGYTTGTCAAAAAKAAAMALRESGIRGKESREITVEITLPKGKGVSLKALIKEVAEDYAVASVIKDAGDDPDVTDGVEIVAKVVVLKSEVRSQKSEGKEGVIIKGGRGVGIATKAGLQVPVGASAINPVPRMMIKEAVKEVLGDKPVEVTIEVPEGEEIAKKTFNPRLGISGGISIIGTTGIVEPMSLEALKATIRCEIDVAVEESGGRSQQRGVIYLAPGKIGEETLKNLFGDIRVVQMSNFIGEALEYARTKGIERVTLGGHPGKLAKILMGYYDTHSRNSPQATGFVAEYLGVKGEFNTVEEIIMQISHSSPAQERKFSELAKDIAEKIGREFGFSHIEIFLFDMKKNLIGDGRWNG